jgi:sugar phosphate isomerase/epimerase
MNLLSHLYQAQQMQRIGWGYEMHPRFVVYNAATLLCLREAVGEQIGANYDPSHLFWQGADPIEVVRTLGAAIYHVHAKDMAINPHNARLRILKGPGECAQAGGL